MNAGGSFGAAGQIYAFGRTDQSTPGAGIEAEFGFGPPGSDPRVSENGWAFRAAKRDVGFDLSSNNDQYEYAFASDPGDASERAYVYLFRFRVDGGPWLYCDRDGSGGVEGLEFFPDEVGYVEITAEPCSSG